MLCHPSKSSKLKRLLHTYISLHAHSQCQYMISFSLSLSLLCQKQAEKQKAWPHFPWQQTKDIPPIYINFRWARVQKQMLSSFCFGGKQKSYFEVQEHFCIARSKFNKKYLLTTSTIRQLVMSCITCSRLYLASTQSKENVQSEEIILQPGLKFLL